MIQTIGLIFIASFVVCLLATKFLIKKFSEKGVKPYAVHDMYKKGKPLIPNLGGLGIVFGILAGLTFAQFLVQDVSRLLIFYFIVMAFAIFTLTDDLINVGRKAKIFVPFFLALPIALLNLDTTFSFYFFEVEMGIFFTYVVAPTYLMVVANLVNMHSGFNGLQTGLSSILLLTIAAKVFMNYGLQSLYFIAPVLGAVLAFWYFDRYPSRIFLGNVGSYTIGPAIGGLLILNNMEMFGVVILAPHIINFLAAFWQEVVRGNMLKTQLFAGLKKDGTIEPPKFFTLKWFPAYFFRLTERQLTYVMYAMTVFFCAMGLVFF